MSAVITAVLALIEQLLPMLTSSANVTLIDGIIEALTKMLPFIIQEVEALVTPVKNIIAALSATPATTAAQLAQLQALDAQVDSAFDAAAGSTDAGI
jgi:malonyl CoA-acyl carrier protein transacylase